MSGLPVHKAKIHRPLLRDDVLSRDRLNGWLDSNVDRSLILVIADAGYGKTTLLADWSRGTPRRTIWYRLEPDDRDWLTFVRHLVAGVHALDSAAVPDTVRLLAELGPGGPSRDQIVSSFVAELDGAARSGLTLILDDFHHVDDEADVASVASTILDRSGPGLSLILAARTEPRLPLARLRSHGRAVQIGATELCFDRDEAERLFRDAYRHPLEPDVLTDLVSRTQGWPASLGLVRTAIEDRSASGVRSFVRHLSGARGDIHDFLAEEVVGRLPDDLQQFLMRASILDAVEPSAVAVVDRNPEAPIADLIARAETLGMVDRPDEDSPHRFHPLVREFLEARLVAQIGSDAVRDLHLALGTSFEGRDWRVSATHYSRAGDQESVARVIDAAVDEILASGSYRDATPFITTTADSDEKPASLILRSRIEMGRGDLDGALDLAGHAIEKARARDRRLLGVAMLNAASLSMVAGVRGDVVERVRGALSECLTAAQRDVAEAVLAVWASATDGDLMQFASRLRTLSARQDREGLAHYAAVSRLNLAAALYWLGDVEASLDEATEADLAFARRPTAVERPAVAAIRGRALAHLGRLDLAVSAVEECLQPASHLGQFEALFELAHILCQFGSLDEAESTLASAGAPDGAASAFRGPWSIVAAEIALRHDDLARAGQLLDGLDGPGISADIAARLRQQLLRARIAARRRDEDAEERIEAAQTTARAQRSRLGSATADLLSALQGQSESAISRRVVSLRGTEVAVLSVIAEEVASNLHLLDDTALRVIESEAARRPARWSSALVSAVRSGGLPSRRAAELLGRFGGQRELADLTRTSERHPAVRSAVAALARRLAPRFRVRDLGPVLVERDGGPRQPRRPIRRRALGLLCYLITRPRWSATKDEVLDALWPELSPEMAANSLNQTIYFLRRVFEPAYSEWSTAGYVRFDGETVALDAYLVEADSTTCRRLASEHRAGSKRAVAELMDLYSARFALDFAYEEWAEPYRSNLHAAVLGCVERAASEAATAGEADLAIDLAQRMLAIDPDADSLELALLRLHRNTGEGAAAAERYAHYAAVMREEVGVPPPELDGA